MLEKGGNISPSKMLLRSKNDHLLKKEEVHFGVTDYRRTNRKHNCRRQSMYYFALFMDISTSEGSYGV